MRFLKTKKNYILSALLICLLIFILFIIFKKIDISRFFTQSVEKPVSIDLKQIKERGKIIALTEFNSTSFFVFKGETMGFHYELLQRFAKKIGVELKVILYNDMLKDFEKLNKGECDIIALNLNVTKPRQELVDFTIPFSTARQILVQRNPDNWINMTKPERDKYLVKDLKKLNGKKIYVQANSSFRENLLELAKKLQITINIVEVDSVTDALIAGVSDKKFDFTVCDENVAIANQNLYHNINFETAVSDSLGMSWAVRKNTPVLLNELNKWLADFIKTDEYAFIYNKYYKSPEWIAQKKKTGYLSVSGNKICVYDQIIKKYSSIVSWDWRLIASLMYQESKFNSDYISSQGAFGLMQIVPITAKRFHLDSLSSPSQNIEAGILHLKELDIILQSKIKDKTERTKFVLAAYNTGVNNVLTAMKRTKKARKNPRMWDDNVEYFIFHNQKVKDLNDPIKKHTLKTYTFVREILERYEYYRTVIKD